eukprot:COSAG06_NODE_53495_length_299_cov_8.245000_1_plen_65_part_01
MCTSTQLLSHYRTPAAKYADRAICLNRPAAEALLPPPARRRRSHRSLLRLLRRRRRRRRPLRRLS